MGKADVDKLRAAARLLRGVKCSKLKYHGIPLRKCPKRTAAQERVTRNLVAMNKSKAKKKSGGKKKKSGGKKKKSSKK